MPTHSRSLHHLSFRFGTVGALLPFLLFLVGVAWLGLSGAPDERGFWPILLAALALGLALCRNREGYAETVIGGMSRPIVLLMVMAWLLAGVLASLLAASGLVESLVWLFRLVGLSGGAYVAAAFALCAVVSTATGTSLGTILLCSPLLYPPAGELAAEPAVLIGAILGGATFGDNISPISDTTIASATTQGADLGGVVRSRLRYALPAAGLALIGFALLGGSGAAASGVVDGSSIALPMIVSPLLVIVVLLARQHLLVGLFVGIASAAAIGLSVGVIQPTELLYIDPEQFGARGLVVDGVERGIGVSIFTLLLAGLVAGLEGSGVVERLVSALRNRAESARGAEGVIFAAVSGAVLLTTHSVVAILTVGEFTRSVGESFGVGRYRRANLLDVTVCTYPFLLPYMIPTILAASTTQGYGAGAPAVSALSAGFHNLHSWALLAMVVVAILFGYGRSGTEVSTS